MSHDPNYNYHINLGPQFSEQVRQIADNARLHHSLTEFARTSEVDLSDIHSVRAHLQTAHMMDHDSTMWRDESQDSVPGISRVNWSRMDSMPEHSIRDLHAIHSHDHGEFDDEEHYTEGNRHWHA